LSGGETVPVKRLLLLSNSMNFGQGFLEHAETPVRIGNATSGARSAMAARTPT
jgi:hypothetical protein